MGLQRFFLPLLLIVGVPAFAVSKGDATVVSAGPLTISVVDGKGAATFSIAVAPNTELPKVDVTAAAAATGDTIQRQALEIKPSFTKRTEVQLVPVTLSVDTKLSLAANTAYTGKVIVFTDPLQEIAFSVTRLLSTSFEVDPKSITTALFFRDDCKRPIRIRNTSTAPLTNLEINLFDFKNAKGIAIPFVSLQSPLAMKRRSETADVVLPYPTRAGTYSGTVEVTGPTGEIKTVAVTYTVRGPYGKNGIPLILFIIVLMAGCAISWGLERRWSERRIEELEVMKRLDEARHDIKDALGVLKLWASASAKLPNTERAFADGIQELDEVKSSIGEKTSDELKKYAAAAANRARAAGALVAELEKLNPSKPIADLVDTVSIDAPDYRNEIRKKISGADIQSLRREIATTETDVDNDLKRIRFVRWSVLMLIVVLTAYQTFLSADPQFGTADDYIKLFIWGLGLTQAGSQIITRVRSMPK